MASNMHDAVRDWLMKCPHIPRLGFNFGTIQDGETLIVPSDALVTSYLNGMQERRYAFDLVRYLPVSYEPGDPGNIDMQQEMDALAAWIAAQNAAGKLPKFPKGCVVHDVVMMDSELPYVTAQDEETAKYLIPFAINYLKE